MLDPSIHIGEPDSRTESHLLPSLCLKDFGPGRQCLRSVRRPLGVRVRMPRQSLSVILRGWHPLVTNQAEKSAIAVYWETASQSVPGSRCHPLASPVQGSLQRCQCIGCSARPTVIVTAVLIHITFQTVPMHRTPQFSCTQGTTLHFIFCALRSKLIASVAQKSRRVESGHHDTSTRS